MRRVLLFAALLPAVALSACSPAPQQAPAQEPTSYAASIRKSLSQSEFTSRATRALLAFSASHARGTVTLTVPGAHMTALPSGALLLQPDEGSGQSSSRLCTLRASRRLECGVVLPDPFSSPAAASGELPAEADTVLSAVLLNALHGAQATASGLSGAQGTLSYDRQLGDASAVVLTITAQAAQDDAHAPPIQSQVSVCVQADTVDITFTSIQPAAETVTLLHAQSR